MADIRSWSEYEKRLLIYAYLYCPVHGVLPRRTPWLIDFLHTMTGDVKRTNHEITNKVEELQQSEELPPEWMKLPAEYTCREILMMWSILYDASGPQDLGNLDRDTFVAENYCRADKYEGPDEGSKKNKARLEWLRRHIHDRGAFRLWSEGMRAAILKLYEEREPHNDEENGTARLQIASSLLGCRKYSNEDILDNADVTCCWTADSSLADFDKYNLEYFFLDYITRGDTSTRKKRLDYYHSYPCPHSDTRQLLEYPGPAVRPWLAQSNSPESSQMQFLSSICLGFKQGLATEPNLSIEEQWHIPIPLPPYSQIPLPLPNSGPPGERISQTFLIQSPVHGNEHIQQSQRAARDFNTIVNASQMEEWLPRDAGSMVGTQNWRGFPYLHQALTSTQRNYPTPLPHLVPHKPRNQRDRRNKRSPAGILGGQGDQGMQTDPAMLRRQHEAGISKSIPQQHQALSTTWRSQPRSSSRVILPGPPTHTAIMTSYEYPETTPETNANWSNWINGYHIQAPEFDLPTSQLMSESTEDSEQGFARPILPMSQFMNGSNDSHAQSPPPQDPFDDSSIANPSTAPADNSNR